METQHTTWLTNDLPSCQRQGRDRDSELLKGQQTLSNDYEINDKENHICESKLWIFYLCTSRQKSRRKRCNLKGFNSRRVGCSVMGGLKWIIAIILICVSLFAVGAFYKWSLTLTEDDQTQSVEESQPLQRSFMQNSSELSNGNKTNRSIAQKLRRKQVKRSSLGSPFNPETFDNSTVRKKKYVIVYWSKIRGFRPRIQTKKEYEQSAHVWPYTYVGDQCPVPCELTNDRSRAAEASAFVVHSRLTDVYDQPPMQHLAPWILQNNENPVYTPALSEPRIMSKFNLLISYRLDSDFPSPIYPKPSLDPPIPFKNRLGNVLAVFSKCEPVRTEYMRQLMKYVEVHSYGACVKNKKGLIGLYSQINGKYVFKDYKFVMSRYYKFSLVFMNQDCDYFVDDRLYHALETGSIPIYMGTDLIDQFLPGNLRNSIIRASNFKNPKELAEYINYVANNETEFNKYLEWKWKGIGDYKNTTIGRWWDQKYPLFCQVCMRLSQGNLHAGLDVDKCKPRGYEEWGLEPPYPKVFPRKRQEREITKEMLLYWRPLFIVGVVFGVLLLLMNCCVWCVLKDSTTVKVDS